MNQSTGSLVRLDGVEKCFGAVRALAGVSIDIMPK